MSWQTLKQQIERKLLQKEKWAISRASFSLRGSYQYGMFGNESTYTDVAIAPTSPILLRRKTVIRWGQVSAFR